MTPQRLQSIIESYGAAPERWPAAERDAAAALLAAGQGDPRLLRLLAEAGQLDLALASWSLPPLPLPALPAALLARARERANGWLRPLRWLLGLSDGGFVFARPLLTALMPLALGFGAAIALEPGSDAGVDDDAVLLVTLAAFAEPTAEDAL